jgi:lipopolysaccharide/colanic/teichoic acid biosynthesis glycosyltransferase
MMNSALCSVPALNQVARLTLKFRPNAWCNSLGKRIFDITVSIVVLLCALPLLPVIALLIKLTSRGPVLFVHERVGLYGKRFKMLKFRTMRQTAPSSGIALTRHGDGRVTLVGRYLRRWKLDELPQLLNVIRGDMSIVGPRPHMQRLLGDSPELKLFLSLRPGVTGLATMLFRHEESILPRLSGDALELYYIKNLLPDKVQLELQYAQIATFGADLRILLRTVQQVLSRGQQGQAAIVTSQRILSDVRPKKELR